MSFMVPIGQMSEKAKEQNIKISNVLGETMPEKFPEKQQ